MVNNEHIQSVASEFHWDEEKLIKKLANEWTPSFKARDDFKSKLDTKIQDKIRFMQEKKQEQAALDAVPKKLKWRFYLTWYWYAVCSFLVLFLIWFCTNIFTWMIKLPTKYTYLNENKAFWDSKELGKYDSFDTAEEVFIEGSADVDGTSSIRTLSLWQINGSLENVVANDNFWAAMKSITTSMATEEVESQTYWDYLLGDWFMYDKTYRFAYKSKQFPKLNSEYPVYKSSWVLMSSNSSNQFMKNLKIWGVSFKNFEDLEIGMISIEQNVENWYNITYENYNKILNFYPNDTWKAQSYDFEMLSKKQILKNVEKNLKTLWVSLKNYWDGEVDVDDFDKTMWIINVFYPFEIQWRQVRYAGTNERVWMEIAYDLNLEKIVHIIWIDIATYEVSNYPTLEKEVIESEIEKWWSYYNQWALHEDSTVILFDSMEIVYLYKELDNWKTIYIPAIKWDVSTSLENYTGPNNIFEEII